jgi:two-component system CheB/CheR fusion protein
LFDDSGRPRGAIAAITDITERNHAAAQREMLLGELQHRVKNVLATVSALATRMRRGTESIDIFTAAFLDRLKAMGTTHDLLSRRDWSGVDLAELLRSAIGGQLALNPEAIQIQGPPLLLRPNVAATLGMVFHELVTNAAKYGALSTQDGQIAVNWRIDDGRRLALDWTERGGPAVAPPKEPGFGTTFVRRALEYEMEGSAEIDYAAEGLRCSLQVPLTTDTDAAHGPASG